MKKKVLYIVIPILVVLIGAGGVFGVWFLNSPEYTLWKMSKDVAESGVDGLMPYLTDEAKETVNSITALVENPVAGAIIGFLGSGGDSDVVTKLKEMDWELVDMLKGKGRADAVLGFNYNDQYKGQIEINMVQVNGEWKINGIQLPNTKAVE